MTGLDAACVDAALKRSQRRPIYRHAVQDAFATIIGAEGTGP
jgi:hypothetical protein